MVKSVGVSFTLHRNSQGRLPGSPLDVADDSSSDVTLTPPWRVNVPPHQQNAASNAAYRADRSRSPTTIRTAVAAEEPHSHTAFCCRRRQQWERTSSIRTPLTIRTAVAAEEQQSQTAVAAEQTQTLTEVDSDSSQALTLTEVEAPDEVIFQGTELFKIQEKFMVEVEHAKIISKKTSFSRSELHHLLDEAIDDFEVDRVIAEQELRLSKN